MLRPNAAQRLLRNTQIGSDHAQRNAVDKRRRRVDQPLIAFVRRSEMKVIETLLQLNDTRADQQPAQPLDIVKTRIQLFKIGMGNGKQRRRLQKFDAPNIGLMGEKADDRNGNGPFGTDPVRNILAVFKIVGSGEPLPDKIKMLTDAAGPQKRMPLWQLHRPQHSRQLLAALLAQPDKTRDIGKKAFHGAKNKRKCNSSPRAPNAKKAARKKAAQIGRF